MSKKIAIIPARSGSKRIPNKNIKLFLGEPIISYVIKTAIESDLFDEVMVSTDSEEIAKIAIDYGAKVPFFRTEKNATDYASTIDVLIEVIKEYKKIDSHYNYGCCLYSTAPFITINQLKKAYKILINKAYDTVFTAIKYGHPIERAFKLEKNNKVILTNPKRELTRTQDLSPNYHDAGQFYWFKTTNLIKNKTLLNGNVGALKLKELEVQDIDNPEDWKLAELKYKTFLK